MIKKPLAIPFGYGNMNALGAYRALPIANHSGSALKFADSVGAGPGGADSAALRGMNFALTNFAKHSERSFSTHLTGGALIENIPVPGALWLGQVAAISGTQLTLWRLADSLNFQLPSAVTPLVLVAATSDGSRVGVQHSGSATVASPIDGSTGTLTASANWTSTIPALAVGDWLFAQGTFGVAQAVTGNPSLSAGIFRVNHGLEKTPRGWQVARVSGPRPAVIRELGMGSNGAVFESLYTTTIDLLFIP